MNDDYRRQTQEEYRRILRTIRNHPSIVMYTLGCELTREVEASFLRTLYDIVKEETKAPLVRDNSGSAECYGGVHLEFADYHDYHFYTEATSFTDLIDYFVPAWKPIKPLVFGEYCDSDTYRSVSELKQTGGRDFYWSHDDPLINPRGVRWDYNVVTNEERIAALDIDVASDEIHRRSRFKTLEYRKSIIEQTRIHPYTSGYVITNIQDTPITTSGVLDDFGLPKFDAESFRRFNAPTVVSFERDRRRVWRRGGDRPQYQDRHVFVGGESFGVTIIIAHAGAPVDDVQLDWQLTANDNEVVGSGSVSGIRLITGTPTPAATPYCVVPKVRRPRRMVLSTRVHDGTRCIASNRHEFWIVPEHKRTWDDVFVYDRRGIFTEEADEYDVTIHDPDTLADRSPSDNSNAVLVTDWAPKLLDVIGDGTPVVALLDATTNGLTEDLPFFREAIPLVHDHPIVDEIPHGGYAGVMWSGITPDRALRPASLEKLGFGWPIPIVSRLDSRTSLLTYYAVELRGGGAPLILTTFALTGGFGRTPRGLRQNVFGRYLLDRMIEHVTRIVDPIDE